MDEKVLRSRLMEISETLAALPAMSESPSSQGSYASETPTPSKTSEGLLDHIRLQSKYLLFDLEATRRENRYLREMLERRTSFGGEGTEPM